MFLLSQTSQELAAVKAAKVKQAKDLQAKEQDLIDTMQSLVASLDSEMWGKRDSVACACGNVLDLPDLVRNMAKDKSRSKEEDAKSQASALKTRIDSDESKVVCHG